MRFPAQAEYKKKNKEIKKKSKDWKFSVRQEWFKYQTSYKRFLLCHLYIIWKNKEILESFHETSIKFCARISKKVKATYQNH